MSCVLITGAAGGLGWALAQAFYHRGHSLLLTDLQQEDLSARAGTLNKAPAHPQQRVLTLAGDITHEDHQQSLLAMAREELGGVSLLVNNAGITHRSLARQTDPAVLAKVMAVDWQAPLTLALGALPQLQQHRGGMITIGSMAGWMPVLGRTGYCAAKAALAQSFEVLRCEQMHHGVRLLMVYPSFIATPIEQNALGGDGRPARHPRSVAGRVQSAEWMAQRIVTAWDKGHKRVYSDRFSRLASLLWRLAPDLYQRLMMRQFAVELEQ
ncbi:MAG: SDR family NAD(P)-dependent oxidoreductase [Oleiphilaceae bacterium]|nr:SDR family NAD(P)-dependent oxidoreductase [Oleiphilaceae bacterium]